MADRRRERARRAAAVLAVGLGMLAGDAGAQPGAAARPRPRPGYVPPGRFATPPDDVELPAEGYDVSPSPPEPGAIERTFGLERATSLLGEPDFTARLRGVERLQALGTNEAIGELVLLLEDATAGHAAARLRLEAIRALAPHAAVEEAREALIAVASAGSSGRAPTPLDLLGLETAAMVLARSGDERAIAALLAAVILGGEAGAAAEPALRAYPPSSMVAFVGRATLAGKPKPIDRALVGLLGRLGDLRAIPVLRPQLALGRPELEIAAARALAALGDGSVAPRLRRWLHPPTVPSPKGGEADEDDGSPEAGARWTPALAADARLAAVEGLLLLDDQAGSAGLVELLRGRATRRAGLDLARRWPSPALVGPLDALLGASPTREERERVVELLGIIGDEAAAAVLLRMLAVPEVSTMAAFGLASSPSPAASRGMARALEAAGAGRARRLMLRAAIVRYAKLGDVVEGLDAALRQARAATDPADRWTAAQGLALRGIVPIAELLASTDAPSAIGASSVAVALGDAGMEACAERLRGIGAALDRQGPRAAWALGPPDAAAPIDAVACGVGLLRRPSPVSSSVLCRWAEAGGVLAPLAARALGALDPPSLRSRVRQLLRGTDPTVRAHVALGLGRSPAGDATTLLADAYRAEAEPAVRRAVVRALALRDDALRRGPLVLAAELDPDRETRRLARVALRGGGHEPEAAPTGRAVLWLSLLASAGLPAPAVAMRPVQVTRSDGSSHPAVSAPDGNLLAFGLPRAGTVAVRIAPATVLGKPEP